MNTIDTTGYPPAVAQLLEQMPLAPLGPGTPIEEFRGKLVAIESAFAPGSDRNHVAACRAGLWLAFNFHDNPV